MKKIKVEIIKDNDVGLKKGTFKVLLPGVAKSMIKKGYAKFVENVEVVSKKQFNQSLILEEIEDLKKRIAKLETKKKEDKK